tara:strand:+ start:1011 stop:1223 length:213 start_codon:yes stop_codon:yes gene_type:complete
MTLPTYNGMPPVSPPHKPTPTIPQMADEYERDTFAVETMYWLHFATCWIGGVLVTTFLISLLYRFTFGGF